MSTEVATLAGGCFWGMQDLLCRHSGVISTPVGNTGGAVPNEDMAIARRMPNQLR